MSASSPAVRRLQHDFNHLLRQGNPQLAVAPSSRCCLEWHFLIHSLPEDTVYSGGVYHGKLVFPEQYPHAPPGLIMFTPSGRLKVKSRLCLSMTDFHPESWNPAWSIESMLVGVISFMLDESEPTSIGALHESAETRLKLATQSRTFNVENEEFCELFPEWAQALRSTPTKPPASIACSCSEIDADIGSASPSTLEKTGELAEQSSSSETLVAPPMPRHLIPSVIGASSDGATAGVSASSVVEDLEDPSPECWICRDDTSEPLIHPCACRGSMSGVHASCVEVWLAHHRAVSNDKVPQCSVCNHPYSGTERRPGLVDYIKHLSQNLLQLFLRSLFQIGLLLAYLVSAKPGILPLPLRLVLFVPSFGFFSYQTLVLAVSLPLGTPSPNNTLRRFHTSDFRMLTMHMTDTMSRVVVAAVWYLRGVLQLPFFLPICFLVILLLCTVLVRISAQTTLRGMMFRIALVLVSPILVLINVALAIRQQPKRLVDPFDAYSHIVVALAVHLLCWFCPTSTPVLALWVAHSTGLIVGIFDVRVLRRMPWREGPAWWSFVQLSLLDTYFANVSNNFQTGLFWENSQRLIGGSSLIWLSLCSSLAFCVNWQLCVRQYRNWQHQHGSFTLHSMPENQQVISEGDAYSDPSENARVGVPPPTVDAPAETKQATVSPLASSLTPASHTFTVPQPQQSSVTSLV
eukprot:TRINITY_DN11826_c0_g2_i1.p1 TRINITY_DN11826_c0_g2~~TRINITY_DN11826_c0_g2_i1.p1  ORF type:complete len:689 (+),score=57.57 TRINITY_DN11826_c0_g2_i1:54-2120(+)